MKFSCACIETESIILNIFVSFVMQQIYDELKSEKFAIIMIDATWNHKHLKVLLILIRYFNPKTRIQIHILEITNLKDGTTDILTNYIMEIFNK